MSRKARMASLLALESRVRARIAQRIRGLLRRLIAFFARLLRKATARTGLELLSQPDVYSVLRTLIEAAKAVIVALIRAVYGAAARVGRTSAGEDLARFGHHIAGKMPNLGRAADTLADSATRAFDQILLSITDDIRDAYDGVSGRQASAARVLTVQSAIRRNIQALGRRSTATGSYATYQGATDAQLRTYEQYQDINPAIRLRKRWHATLGACERCQALDGHVIDVTGVFPSDEGYAVDVAGPLTGPPLHPSCRCDVTLDV